MGLKLKEVEIEDESPFIGKPLKDVEVKAGRPFLVVALIKSDGTVTQKPPLSTILQSKDRLLLMGHEDELPQLADKVNPMKGMTYRGSKAGR